MLKHSVIIQHILDRETNNLLKTEKYYDFWS